MPTYTQLAVDTFNRANENPINPSNWTTRATFHDLQVLSNLCKSSANNSDAGAFYTGVVFPNDQYVEATVSQLTNNGTLNVMGRSNNDATVGYTVGVAVVTAIGNPDCVIELSRNSDSAVLGSFTGVVNINDTVRLEMLGQSLAVKLNGVVIMTTSDSNNYSGAPGLALSVTDLNTDASCSHFAAGLISAL